MVPARSTATPKDAGATTAQEGRHRAAALPPEERRASIVTATIELLCEHGTAVTTRQIADAAGVAEGTIFRVFDDKDSIIEAAIESAFDPEPLDRALRSIDLSLPLEERLRLAAGIIQRRIEGLWKLMSSVGSRKPPDRYRGGGDPNDKGHRLPGLTALTELFEPDRARLRRDPGEAAELFRGLVYGASNPAMVVVPLELTSIVDVFLHGIEGGEVSSC
jgi:AcrR family transcriptional regulator